MRYPYQIPKAIRYNVMMAISLLGDRDVLLFHNTQAHLDFDGSNSFINYLKTNVKMEKEKSVTLLNQDKTETQEEIEAPEPTKTAVLSTSNVLLAEELCTKIGMFADGELLSITSAEELRKMYGDGYTLQIKLPRISNRDLEHQGMWWDFVESRLQKRFGEEIGLTESFLDRRVYLVTCTT